jgi:hypothetical protein
MENLFTRLTNPSTSAWNDEPDKIADDDFYGYDGTIEISV